MNSLPTSPYSSLASTSTARTFLRLENEATRVIDDCHVIKPQDLEPLLLTGINGWLTSVIMDAYIHILRRTATDQAHLFTSKIATTSWSSSCYGLLSSIYPRHSSRYLKSKHIWSFPIYRYAYWLFAAADFTASNCILLDPFGAETGSFEAKWAFPLLRNIINRIHFSMGLGPVDFQFWTYSVIDLSFTQNDSSSCGLFVLKSMQLVSLGQDLATLQFDPLKFWEEILCSILS